MDRDPLWLRELIAIAREVPASVLESFCRNLDQQKTRYQAGEQAIIPGYATQPESQAALKRLLGAWKENAPGLSPESLAWAIRAAVAMDESWRASQSLELIWTGPTPRGSVLRRTDQALLEVIKDARERLTIVTFAAFRIPFISKALMEALQRNVQVRLILESSSISGGKVGHEPLEGLGEDVARASEVYVWPLDQRPRDAAGHYGSLHVKCAVADRNKLLVSSANLTEFALNLNMEMGLLIRGGQIPHQVEQHLENLIRNRILVRSTFPATAQVLHV